MTSPRRKSAYRSGHCTGNAHGGHTRCKGVYGPTTCSCTCHTPPTTEDVRP